SQQGAIGHLAYSPDDKHIALAITNRVRQPHVFQLQVWEVAGRRQVLSVPDFRGSVAALCFSPDGSRLAAGTEDGEVGVWDMQTLQRLFREKTGDRVWSLAFSPDSKRLAWATFRDQVPRGTRTYLWNGVTNREVLFPGKAKSAFVALTF